MILIHFKYYQSILRHPWTISYWIYVRAPKEKTWNRDLWGTDLMLMQQNVFFNKPVQMITLVHPLLWRSVFNHVFLCAFTTKVLPHMEHVWCSDSRWMAVQGLELSEVLGERAVHNMSNDLRQSASCQTPQWERGHRLCTTVSFKLACLGQLVVGPMHPESRKVNPGTQPLH